MMISMDEIENAKENVQPMKHGRSAAALVKQIALTEHRGAREKLIEQQQEYVGRDSSHMSPACAGQVLEPAGTTDD